MKAMKVEFTYLQIRPRDAKYHGLQCNQPIACPSCAAVVNFTVNVSDQSQLAQRQKGSLSHDDMFNEKKLWDPTASMAKLGCRASESQSYMATPRSIEKGTLFATGELDSLFRDNLLLCIVETKNIFLWIPSIGRDTGPQRWHIRSSNDPIALKGSKGLSLPGVCDPALERIIPCSSANPSSTTEQKALRYAFESEHADQSPQTCRRRTCEAWALLLVWEYQ